MTVRQTIFLLAWAAFGIAAADAAEISGSVDKVVDGDTFWLCEETVCHKIRLCGIDAPERGEAGYRRAGEALASMVKDKTVRCIQVGGGTPCDGRSKPTNRGRIVAQCFASQSDIAGELVRGGFACDWVKFSGGHYSQAGTGATCSKSK